MKGVRCSFERQPYLIWLPEKDGDDALAFYDKRQLSGSQNCQGKETRRICQTLIDAHYKACKSIRIMGTRRRVSTILVAMQLLQLMQGPGNLLPPDMLLAHVDHPQPWLLRVISCTNTSSVNPLPVLQVRLCEEYRRYDLVATLLNMHLRSGNVAPYYANTYSAQLQP